MTGRAITIYTLWSAFKGRKEIQQRNFRKQQLDHFVGKLRWLRANHEMWVGGWSERIDVTYTRAGDLEATA